MHNAKREKEVLTRWRKLIVGVQIRMRLHNDYAKCDLSDMEEGESEFYHGESEGESELYHGDTEEEDNNNSIDVDESNKSNETILDNIIIDNNDYKNFSDDMDTEDDFVQEEKEKGVAEDRFMCDDEDEEMHTEGGFIREEENDTGGGFIREERE
jgi:hypothetical protein